MSVGQVYAHYYAKNVKNAATLGSSLLNQARSRSKALANAVKSQASEKSKQQYANVLNSIFKRATTQPRKFDDARAREILQNLVLSKAEEYFTLDESSGAVQKIIDKPDAVFKPNDKIQSYHQKYYLSDASFNQLIETIMQIIKDMSTRSTLSKGDPAAIIAKLQAALQAFEKNVRVASSEIEDPSLRALFKSVEAKSPNIKEWVNVQDPASQNLLAFINDVISTYYYSYTGATIEQGDLFEKAGVMAGYLMQDMTLDAIEDKLTEVLGEGDLGKKKMGQYGHVKSDILYSTSYIPNRVRKKTFLQQDAKSINGTTITSKYSSQQKVDIIVDLKDDDLQRVPTTMSLKSYNLSHAVGIVAKTPLWYLMQDEPLSFINSYLDIMVSHKESIQTLVKAEQNKKKKTRTKSAKEWFAGFKLKSTSQEEKAAANILTQQRHYAIAAAELMAFSKALTGATFGRTAAQIMVINDTNTKRILVFEMSDIIKYILTMLNQGESLSKLIRLTDGTNFNVEYDNNWESTKGSRIAKLINALHQQKISMAIRPSVFERANAIIGQ